MRLSQSTIYRLLNNEPAAVACELAELRESIGEVRQRLDDRQPHDREAMSVAAAAKRIGVSIDTVLSPPQIAKELRVSPDTVLNWCRTKQLKAANIATGKRPRYKIRRCDLEKFLQLRSI